MQEEDDPPEQLRERQWRMLVPCKQVLLRGSVVACWKQRGDWRHPWKLAVIPTWNAKGAIEKLGRRLSEVEVVALTSCDSSVNMMPVFILTRLLLRSRIQSLTIAALQDYRQVFWQILANRLLKLRPQALQEIRVESTRLPLKTIAVLCKLFWALPSLRRLVFVACTDLLVWYSLVDMVAFRLNEFCVIRSDLGDEKVKHLLTGVVSQDEERPDRNPYRLRGLYLLQLVQVGMTGASVPSLITMLRHSHVLHTLDLSNNQIGDDGGKLLASYLRENPPLQKLLLFETNLGGTTLMLLANSIHHNTTLRIFGVSSVELCNGTLYDFLEAIGRNQCITTLRLGHVAPDIERTLEFLCARNSISGKLNDAATWPAGLFPDMLAHVPKVKEGASILYYLLRSKRVPIELLLPEEKLDE